MELEFLVASTAVIVDKGLPESTIKSADANKPKEELTCSRDLFVSDNHVHKLMVRADRPTTTFCVVCNWVPSSNGRTDTTYQIEATQPGTLENVTYGFRTDNPYTNQHNDDTAIIANGTGFRSLRESFLLAWRTAVKGEK